MGKGQNGGLLRGFVEVGISSTDFVFFTNSTRHDSYPKYYAGDSGGPLTVEQRMSEDDRGPIRRELVGVVHAVGAITCSSDVPDKYTAVAKYLDWIKEL